MKNRVKTREKSEYDDKNQSLLLLFLSFKNVVLSPCLRDPNKLHRSYILLSRQINDTGVVMRKEAGMLL